jgi:hypothetical protein
LAFGTSVSGLTTAVHDGNDKNEVRLNRVRDAERKHSREAAADILVEDAPSWRPMKNSVDHIFNGGDEPVSHRQIALCVVKSSLPRTRQALPDGTDISSPEGVAQLATSRLAGNRIDVSGAHLVPPAHRPRHPQLVNAPERAH